MQLYLVMLDTAQARWREQVSKTKATHYDILADSPVQDGIRIYGTSAALKNKEPSYDQALQGIKKGIGMTEDGPEKEEDDRNEHEPEKRISDLYDMMAQTQGVLREFPNSFSAFKNERIKCQEQNDSLIRSQMDFHREMKDALAEMTGKMIEATRQNLWLSMAHQRKITEKLEGLFDYQIKLAEKLERMVD